MNYDISKSKRLSEGVLIATAGIPALLFYFLLSTTAFNLPVYDDYSLLNFVNNFSQLNGLASKFIYIINFQHNEYKLVFVNAVFAVQYTLFGYIDFSVLSMIGSAFVIILYILLAIIFKNPANTNVFRVLWFLPISLLLFQLQYASTLNFSMAGLQNISVLAFSLASIALLANNSHSRFAGACIALLFSICASGNGFLLLPVGGLLLIERKRWLHILIWIFLGLSIALVYFNNYSINHSVGHDDSEKLIKLISQFNLIYILAFIGSSIAKYQNHIPSVAFGIFLLSIWLVAVKNKYSTKNPAVFYYFIFLMFTAVAVSTIRSGLGVEQSLSSRYRIYSNLILILTYIFLIESYFERIKNKKIQYTLICLSILFSAIFFVMSNSAGYRFLKGRQQAITYEMEFWKTGALNKNVQNSHQLNSNFDPAVNRQLELGIYKPVTSVLLESIRLGVYKPPEYSK